MDKRAQHVITDGTGIQRVTMYCNIWQHARKEHSMWHMATCMTFMARVESTIPLFRTRLQVSDRWQAAGLQAGSPARRETRPES